MAEKLKLTPEQKEAIQFNEGNILVSASAGSGKTFVMVERAIRLISEGKANVNEILAVTFTEEAASQMKAKIKDALIDKINDGDKKLESQLNELYTADISTLHSFCGRLIRKYFYTVNVSPDFTVIDETGADELKQKSLQKLFLNIYAKKDIEVLEFLDKYKSGRKDEGLKEIITSIYGYSQSEVLPEEFLKKSLDNYGEVEFNKIVTELNKKISKRIGNIKDKAERYIKRIDHVELLGENFLEDIICYSDKLIKEGIYSNVLNDYVKPSVGRKRVVEDSQREYKKLCVGLRDELDALINGYRKYVTDIKKDFLNSESVKKDTKILIDLVNGFKSIYEEKKRDENALDFNDLEHFGLRVLEDENARCEIRNKFKYIFVDEYQDINGVQEEIIKRVSNNNLFMVGDDKQSIYGFRGCRPEIFVDKLSRMEKNNEKTIHLNSNYRSASNVISAVNQIFDYCMVKEFFGFDYKEKSRLTSGGIYEEGKDGRFTLHFFPEEKSSIEYEEARIYDVLEESKKQNIRDASNLSAVIQKIIQEELSNTYFDFKSKTERAIDYSDIVILTRNKDNEYVSNLTADLIRRNIPVSSEATENVCDFPEVALLVNALRLVDCFKLDSALVSVLKSAIGNFTEEDLSLIALHYSDNGEKGFFYDAVYLYINEVEDELSNRLKNFVAYFNDIRYLSDYLGARGVLEKIITDCDYENCMIAGLNGDSKIKRIRKFLSLSEKDGKSKTVSEFLDRIDRNGKEFCITECADENAVKIMTIHASKGLEFPVVIECGLERDRYSRDESEKVLFDRDYGIALRYHDVETRRYSETPLRCLIKERMRENAMKEEMRLFYVATTRAKYSLHLLCEESADEKRKDVFEGANKFIEYVPKSLSASRFGDEREVLNVDKELPTDLIGKPNKELTEKLKENFAYLYPHELDTVLPLKSSVTASLNNNGEYKTHVIYADEKDVTDNEKGIIAHKILQNYSFVGKLSEQISEMIDAEMLTQEEVKSIDVSRLEKALENDAFKNLENKKLYREQSFICEIEANRVIGTLSEEKILLQGVIDLLVVDKNFATIVDYKYSKLSKESLKEKYYKQLELYSYAVESVLGLKVKEKILINIFTGESVQIK